MSTARLSYQQVVFHPSKIRSLQNVVLLHRTVPLFVQKHQQCTQTSVCFILIHSCWIPERKCSFILSFIHSGHVSIYRCWMRPHFVLNYLLLILQIKILSVTNCKDHLCNFSCENISWFQPWMGNLLETCIECLESHFCCFYTVLFWILQL